MEKQYSDANLKYLVQGILMLHTREECLHFLEDLCTPSELEEMAKRLQAAKMLKGNHVYAEIAEQTGLSTATISRVNRCLKYGNEGYLTVLDRMEKAGYR